MLALASATNLLILFLGLEAMSFGFYILVAIDLKRANSGETGLKYLLPGALSTAFLAFGIALLYTASGSLSIQGVLRLGLANGASDPVAIAGWACILAGIAFKLSLAPAHLWTPDVYQGAPAPVVAFLSGGSKGGAILLLLMLLPTVADVSLLRVPLWGLAFLSIMVGNLAALLQNRVRRLMAYSSIAQMGYVVVALLSGRGGGYQAAAFYALAYGVISLATFGAITVFEREGVGETLDDYRGLGRTKPFVSGVLALSMFALAGIPPTAGFTGKFLIFASALRAGEIALAIAGLLMAALSVFYYLRVVVTLYCKKSDAAESAQPSFAEYLVLSIASTVIILFGLWPNTLILHLSKLLP
jgi:NADH-quinone oxidoreductase subunit N